MRFLAGMYFELNIRMKHFLSLFQLNKRGIRPSFRACRMEIHANSHKQLKKDTTNCNTSAPTIHVLHNCVVIIQVVFSTSNESHNNLTSASS